MTDESTIPQLIEVKKYPNRRLYDSTRSRHLTHEELYDLVIAGHTVRVTESKSGADITNLVLMQALIERNPEKFASFPPELIHLVVRASDQMLRGFAMNWFSQVMAAMTPPAGATVPPGWPAMMTPPFGMPGMPGGQAAPWAQAMPWATQRAPSGSAASSGSTSSAGDAAIRELEAKLAAMREEFERWKRAAGGG